VANRLLTFLAFVFACTLCLAFDAQAQQPTAPRSENRLTVTGCVDRADQYLPTGTAAATDVGSQDYVLVDANSTAAAKAPTVATGTAGSVDRKVLYRLLSADGSKLGAHVGHKVELSGTLERTPPAGDEPVSATGVNAPGLSVDSVKMLSATCAE